MKINRRSFLTKAAAGSIALSGIPAIVKAALPSDKKKKKGVPVIQPYDTILFQGDSITDAGRDRGDSGPNSAGGLGNGYSFLLAAYLLNEYPADQLRIYNRGISGNKVFQLADRWKQDCLSIEPNVLSILVGVNDYWHTLTHNYTGTVGTYEEDLLGLLRNTQSLLPNTQLVLGEPFAMTGCASVDESWFPAFTKYQEAAKRVSKEVDAIFIPYQDVFNKAAEVAPANYWTHDGVHPSVAGCQLMAEAWKQAVL